MKKFINSKDTLVEEMLEGYELLNNSCSKVKGNLVISTDLEKADRVTIVTFGGSGHEPGQLGFVGDGMLDIQVVGDIFTAPNYKQVYDAVKKADKGHGVLLLVLNHAGDMLTGNMVMKLCEKNKLNVKMIVTEEDISTEPRINKANRRGLSGAIPLYHIVNSYAKEGHTLDEVYELANRYANSMATLGVCINYGINPKTGESFGKIGDDEMIIGAGQHGDASGGVQKMRSSKEIVKIMLDELIKDLDIKKGEEVFLMINGAGATSRMEELILFKDCHHYLEKLGIKIKAHMVGDFLTTQGQAGFQLNIVRWCDEFDRLWSKPVNTCTYKK